jgi:predicted PurR-regulated permease PerM
MLEDLHSSPPWLRRLIVVILLGGLLLLSYAVLKPFLAPVIWALILTYVTWPLYLPLRRLLRGQETLSALLMTMLLTAAFIVPVIWLIALLHADLRGSYQELARYLAGKPQLPPLLANIPWLGSVLREFLERMSSDPAALSNELTHWVDQSLGETGKLAGGVGRNIGKLFFAVLTLFFTYRNGEQFAREVREILQGLLGERVHGYLTAIGSTTRAVVYGIVFAAVTQGVLAGLGYWIAGLKTPVLLGAATALFGFIPFGAALVWVGASFWLLLTNHTGLGLGLLLWGVLVVSWLDHVVRALLISNVTRIPFLLVIFGVLGGIAAFGLVGLFIGPVILAMLMAVWREWLHR